MKLVLALGLSLLPVVGAAQPVTWECAFSKESNGWVGKEARYVIDEAAGTATVFDGAIQLIDKKPRAVKYRKKANGEHAMSWKVVGVPGHKKRTVEGTVRMDTEAKLNPKFWATLDPEK